LIAFLVENERDDDVVADGLYIEGHEVSGQAIVSKRLEEEAITCQNFGM
jgi:hypothetical protein